MEKFNIGNYSNDQVAAICIFIIIIYIIGRVFSTKTDCVIFSSVGEVIVLFSPWVVFIVLMFMDVTVSKFVLPISGIVLVLSVFLSIKSNIGHGVGTSILYSTVSIITKITLCIAAPIVLLLVFSALPKATKDRRYRDGTKNNQMTKNISFIVTVAFFIIFSLIKESPQYPQRR